MHEVMWNLTLTVMLELGIKVDEARARIGERGTNGNCTFVMHNGLFY